MEAGGNSRRMDLQAMTTAPLTSASGRPGESEHQGQPGVMTKMSPRRILTAASSSGSDPLASPSNEIISDIDLQVETSSVPHPEMAGIAGSVLASPRLPLVTRGDPSLQAQLYTLEKHYHIQKELLSRQFEEQRRLLEHEQQMKMEEYIKMVMLQRQQHEEELYELQKQKQQEEKRKECWEQLKHKRKDEESAVASAAVKQKLRECLLNKSQSQLHGPSDSPPEFQHWSTQHSSLEQQSPPTTTKWSPPLHTLCKYDEEYPLRKTVSEPSLKMRPSKVSLRQKVMQRNSQLMRRREMYRKRISSTVDQDSSPNSPPTVISSQDSSVDMGILEEEPRGFGGLDFQLSAGSQSRPDITVGQPQRSPFAYKPSAISMTALRGSEAELEMAAALSSHYGSLPLVGGIYHRASSEAADGDSVPEGQEMSGKAFDGDPSDGRGPGTIGSAGGGPMFPSHLGTANLTASYVQALLLARSSLPRTRSEPIPLPVQLLLQQHQLLMQKQQEQLREENRLHQKQKVLHMSGSKTVMENVDESVEGGQGQDVLHPTELDAEEDEEEVDVIVIDDAVGGVQDGPSHIMDGSHLVKIRKAFLDKKRARTISGDKLSSSFAPPPTTSMAAGKPNLERGHSCPINLTSRQVSLDAPSRRRPLTGLIYDPSMVKHVCICQNNAIHPENPDRILSIWSRFEETGLVDRCQLVKSRRAMREELQTCHSEAYVHMYGSSQKHRDPSIFETFAPRFCRLPCGGIGVDSDTVWNDVHTTLAARVAAGCVIEMSYKVATGEIDNGFAVVRPPGHHAEDTQAMGFCYFNSIAIATKLLLDKLHLKRILVLDWDVHHGNSTQQLFYTDPRVLYLSLHRHDNGNFFPGTGAPTECGIDRGLGFTVNIAWYGFPMGDAEYMAAFRTIVMPIAREYRPELVMVSAGFDAAAGHAKPLGGYNLSPQCFGFMTQQLMSLAAGKIVLVLEGGYEMKPLCDGAEICLRALLDQQIELPSESERYRNPCQAAIDTLKTTIQQQCAFWPCLSLYIQTLGWSFMEAQQHLREEAETVSAFACLSVISSQSTCIQNRPDSTTDIAEEQEPMEDS